MRNQGHPHSSWYAATRSAFADLPPLDGDIQADVCVIGAGFTGLGAALELARNGARVVVLEAARVGSGGSGRNGGQIHTGHRREQLWLEARLGADAAMALWGLAEAARENLLKLIADNGIECDLRHGLIHARHRPGGEAEDAAFVDHMDRVYRCGRYELLDEEALGQALGSGVYFGGMVDHGGGHLHPLNLTLGMAKAAQAVGAVIHEESKVSGWRRKDARIVVDTARGSVTSDQLIVSGDGYIDGLSSQIDARVMPINNFIAVTEPLSDPRILPGDLAVADSRFVINYFRKTADNRLLFGGGENYVPWFPADIAGFVLGHMTKIYPQLSLAKITHAWGGSLGVTMNRVPYVRELEPGVWTAAGYSGQGVMLAPWFGAILARATLGQREEADLLSTLPCPPFPGGRLLRWPALVAGMSWYALRDRFG
jgi:gamma-glutamylputrescine oxidase